MKALTNHSQSHPAFLAIIKTVINCLNGRIPFKILSSRKIYPMSSQISCPLPLIPFVSNIDFNALLYIQSGLMSTGSFGQFDFFYRFRIDQTGRIAGVVAQVSAADDAAHDFGVARLGNVADEPDFFGR